MNTFKLCLYNFLTIVIIFTFNICYAQEFHTELSSPVYNGGLKALNKFITENIRYPQKPADNGITGIVTLSYTINDKGRVENIKILRGLSAGYDSEAVRVTRLISGWQPAVQWGKPVSIRVIMPIKFYLKDDNKIEQKITVTGNVTSKVTNVPVKGALILVKGTNVGATTDKNGNYIISVPGEDSQLEFSSLGYSTKSEKVEKNRTINVELLLEDLLIDFSSN